MAAPFGPNRRRTWERSPTWGQATHDSWKKEDIKGDQIVTTVRGFKQVEIEAPRRGQAHACERRPKVSKMPALNFQKRFATLVESGRKRQTIRPEGKRSYRSGKTLYLYVGQRTQHCRKLGEAVCRAVKPIVINPEGVWVGGERLYGAKLEAFARADGFASSAEFRDFFQRRYNYHTEPFYGRVIEWEMVE